MASVKRDASGCGSVCAVVGEVFRSFTEVKVANQQCKNTLTKACYFMYIEELKW